MFDIKIKKWGLIRAKDTCSILKERKNTAKERMNIDKHQKHR